MACDSKAKCQKCYGGKCHALARSKIYGISGYGIVVGEENIMKEIQENGPVPCGIATSDALKEYKSGILTDSSGLTKHDHFVMIYGFG